MLIDALVFAGMLPLVVSAFLAIIMRQLRSPLPLGYAIAITGGFLTAQFTLRNQAGFFDSLQTIFQPHEAVDWLPHIVLLALGVSVVQYLAPTSRRRLTALVIALCLAAPIRLLSGNVAQHWTIPGKVATLVLLAAALGIVWLPLASGDGGKPAFVSTVLQVLVALGTAIVLTQSGVLIYGLSSAALGAAIVGAAPASLRATGSGNASQQATSPASFGAFCIVTFTLGSLIILAHFYAELSTANMLLLFLSLAATAAPLPALVRAGPAWQRSATRVLSCLIPLAIAIVGVVS